MLRRQQRDRLVMAWQIGAFTGFAKPPPLEKLLKQLEPKAPVTPLSADEIMHRMDLWRAAMSTHPN